MGDDTSVSFVFGLEVNWSLLQARQLERQEQEEAHRIQLRRDLEELNKRRRRDKAVLAGENESGSGCSEFEDVPIVASKIKKRGGGKAEPKPVRSDDTSSITNGVYRLAKIL